MKNFQFSVFSFRLAVVLGSWLMAHGSYSQAPFLTHQERTDTRNGNKNFKKENYTDAEAEYKKALGKKDTMPEAIFNLGDAEYLQKRYDDAAKQFQLSAQNNSDTLVKAKAFHNLGNTYLEQQKWQDAVNAYKQSLKLNPKDGDTKYNLAYANAKLQQQKQDEKNKKDQKQEQKKDKQEQQQQPQQADNKQQQQKQQQQPKLSKEEAEKLLQALQNEEQKTNQNVEKKKAKAVVVKTGKDW